MQQVGVDVLQGAVPPNQLLDNVWRPGMHRHPFQTEAHPEEHCRAQRRQQTAPRTDVEDDSMVTEALHPGGFLGAAVVGELQQDLPAMQAHLIEDDRLDLPHTCGSQRAHGHDDQSGALPLFDLLFQINGGRHEEEVVVRPGAGIP